MADPTNAELFRAFGPKLLQALLEEIDDELDELRQALGKDKIKKDKQRKKIKDKKDAIPDYPWMDE